jgi:hypothetical protein
MQYEHSPKEEDAMPGKPKFNANRPRPKLTAAAVRKIRKGKSSGGKGRSNAWRKYVGGGTVSNEPIPW